VKPPRPEGRGFPVRKIKHFYIAPLDPALKDWACGERAGQEVLCEAKRKDWNCLRALARVFQNISKLLTPVATHLGVYLAGFYTLGSSNPLLSGSLKLGQLV